MGEGDTRSRGFGAFRAGNVLLPKFMQLRPTEPGHSPGVPAVVGDQIGACMAAREGDWWMLPSDSWKVPSPRMTASLALSQSWTHELHRFTRLQETSVEQVENVTRRPLAVTASGPPTVDAAMG